MADEVVLIGAKIICFGERVKIALAEKGVKYVLKEEDLKNKSPLLLEMNPIHRTIPVLIHNGKPICESMTIIQYIDEVWNDRAPLLPSDPYQRAQARFWADYIDKKIYSTAKMLWLSEGKMKETATKNLIEIFQTLERELGDGPFFAGESFGYVDVALIPFYSMFYTFETLGNFSMMVECPKIMEWATRCLEKETVSKSISDPYKVHDAILASREC
ncbi:glutathione S-transferase 3 [Ricinus communis]|uniref:Glutathione S-transferase n=1 Tax=Ricinus communis TaxID=3988 RepID=B9RQQ5_RICCO|nr:glutathione S-transferase 3 [Ricinus communis]EEF46494.1 glutathione s-transferase, putative [Ricinus communis]|eukprot:XP_002516074.1 glutathione S-transferase 3 [Ricinus communis]